MLAHEPRVPREVPAPLVLVVGLDRVEVRVERRLRVDDDVLAARQLHDQVGPQQPAVVVALARLLDEVAVRDHPGELDHALQLHLAPAAANVRRAQRGDEVARLLPEPVLALDDAPQELRDRADLASPLLLERARLLLEALERLPDRLELRLRELEERRRCSSRARRS